MLIMSSLNLISVQSWTNVENGQVKSLRIEFVLINYPVDYDE